MIYEHLSNQNTYQKQTTEPTTDPTIMKSFLKILNKHKNIFREREFNKINSRKAYISYQKTW